MNSILFLKTIAAFIISINCTDINTTTQIINYNDIPSNVQEIKINDKILSRKKRYLIFPQGSSFSVATCMTIGIYGNPQFSMFSWGLNWGFSYDLPTNATAYSKLSMDSALATKRSIETIPMSKRRYRRDLYNKMEIAMNHMGYNGRECILRALCESPQIFGNKGNNLISELIRTIFSFPKSKVLSFEHHEINVYDTAHRIGKTTRSTSKLKCHEIYPNCGFSLVKLALGYYAKPLKNFM